MLSTTYIYTRYAAQQHSYSELLVHPIMKFITVTLLCSMLCYLVSTTVSSSIICMCEVYCIRICYVIAEHGITVRTACIRRIALQLRLDCTHSTTHCVHGRCYLVCT